LNLCKATLRAVVVSIYAKKKNDFCFAVALQVVIESLLTPKNHVKRIANLKFNDF